MTDTREPCLPVPVKLLDQLDAIQHDATDEIQVRDVMRLMIAWREYRDANGLIFDE
jgi:hypothetical protein